MHFFLVISEQVGESDPSAELKFIEWLKHLKKNRRVYEYWALKDKPGMAAVLRLNFLTELDELLGGWRQRVSSEFTVVPLKDPKHLEVELAAKLLG